MRRLTFVLATLLAPAIAGAQASAQPADVLLRGGTVVDGTGAPGRRADVAVRDGRITFVGDAAKARIRAARTIDATGLVVAPGFIDPHTHTQADLSSPERRGNANYLLQGVTTVITNNDGGGPVDIGATVAGWTTGGIGTNAALYVPFGSVRQAVMGMSSAAPTPVQLDSMKALVRRGMAAGALGMSTGLYYAPASYATTAEVIELAKVAASAGGMYDSHLRDESSYTVGLLAAVREAISIGREARLPVHIAHIKALGTDVWGRSDSVIAIVNAARAEGLEVTADQYPYTASGSSVGASLLPRWAEAGGRDSLRMRAADAPTRARLVRDMEENLRRRGGDSSLLITSSRDTTILGRTLAQVARARGVPPVEAALQIVLAGDASVASFNMQEADIEAFMKQPWVSTGSDGSAGHPRKYGTFPRKLRRYVYDRPVLPLEVAIEASSARAARQLGLADRGVLAVGKAADVIAFDPATIADRATYEKPTEMATGVRWVLVNGKVAVEDGKPTGVLAGQVLRRTAARTAAVR